MNGESKLIVNVSPHVTASHTTQSLMRDVIIALVPAALAGILFFGLYALLVLCISVLSCVLAEFIFNFIRKRPTTLFDLSAIVTGLILGMNLPPTVPFYIPIIGGFFAIIIVKMLFGGLGRNFANPAATARIFLMLAYTSAMTAFIAPNTSLSGIFDIGDASSAATPLGGADASYLDLFLGNVAGCIGETSALAVLLGGAYLIIRKVIDFRIPLIYLLTVAFLSFVIGGSVNHSLFALLSGGLMFGAFFMATDYATSPKTKANRVLYAMGLGLFTVLIREFGSYPEGVSLSIVIMNMLVPFMDKLMLPVRFGSDKREILKPVLLVVSLAMSVALAIGAPLTIYRDENIELSRANYDIGYVRSRLISGEYMVESTGYLDEERTEWVKLKIYIDKDRITDIRCVDSNLSFGGKDQALTSEYLENYHVKLADVESVEAVKTTYASDAVVRGINGCIDIYKQFLEGGRK